MEKALRFLSAPDNDSLFGMRRAVSALDMFSRDSSSQLHLDSLVVSVLEEGEDAADADGGDGDGGDGDGGDSGLPDDVPRPRRERVVSEGSTGSAGSGARGLRRRSSTVVVSRVASARAVRARRDARHRKSLPLFAMRLFGRKSSSASSSEDAAGSQSPADLEKSASSGNLSSTKSAPATPVGERLQAGAAQAAASSASSVRRRAAGTPSVAPSSSTPTLVPLPSPATSKARHKKFHRHFDSVAPDERVLNYYSCALISDILLQGHLYITSNYFAFYSNVFGYVTKLLIPTASVLKVSKEKTARIIPNAIGVATSDEKHVFGSLLSRDNTYKLMVQVWKTALGPPPHGPHPPQLPAAPLPKELKDEVDSASVSGDVLQEDDDSSLSGDGGPGGLPPVPLDKTPIVKAACKVNASSASSPAAILAPGAALGAAAGASPAEGLAPGAQLAQLAQLRRGTRQTIILGVSTALVAFLLLSTALLFHRMSRIQDQFRIQSGDNLYQDLARWQTHLHARSASQVEEFLNTHLDQLAKVRKSLEALTLLIVSNDDDRMQHADVMMHHHSPYRDQKQQTRPPSPSAEPDAKNS